MYDWRIFSLLSVFHDFLLFLIVIPGFTLSGQRNQWDNFKECLWKEPEGEKSDECSARGSKGFLTIAKCSRQVASGP